MDVVKIGTFIKAQRTELNMTQKDLAEKIGCTDKAVSRWETGKGLPDMSFVIPLSTELKVSVNELLSGEKFIPEFEFSEEAEKVNEIIKKNDEALIDVLEENRKSIRHHTKTSIGLFILCFLQMTVFLIIPKCLPDRSDPVEVTVILSVIISALAGISGNKIKWFFPIAVAFIITVANLFYNSQEVLTYVISLYFAAGSAIIVAISSALAYLCKRLKNICVG